MDSELFLKLVKYNKIQGWACQIFGSDWVYKKCTRKGYAYFQSMEDNSLVEWSVKDIITIGDMTIPRWLDSSNLSENGDLTYLEIHEKTDFENDIQGKPSYEYKGIPFVNDMTVVFTQDINESIRNKMSKITGIGTPEGIQIKRGKGRPRFSKELKGE